jgi:hypothetical protein
VYQVRLVSGYYVTLFPRAIPVVVAVDKAWAPLPFFIVGFNKATGHLRVDNDIKYAKENNRKGFTAPIGQNSFRRYFT